MLDSDILQMFSDLTFDERRHLYFWKNVRVLKSGTGVVKEYVVPFNEAKMLPLSARKASREEGREVTVHELKHRWQTKNTRACDLGTKVHKFMEDYTGHQTPTLPQEEAGIKYLKAIRDEGLYRISLREFRVYSREFGYAGTMDIPLRSILNPREVVIDDYKTNGDLFKAYDMLKAPFEYLESSAYNQYQIQTSLYQIPLEEIGLQVIKRRIVHLKADGEYDIYELQDLTDDLREDLHKKNYRGQQH